MSTLTIPKTEEFKQQLPTEEELFESYSDIKKIDKFCEFTTKKDSEARNTCTKLYSEVMESKIPINTYFDEMRKKFRRNRKMVRAINHVISSRKGGE